MVVVLWPEFMPIDLQMACEGCELASLLWCDRKSLLLLGQFYTFCLLVCQSLPHFDVNANLRSDEKSSTTAHESKKSRIFSTRKSLLSWSRFGINLALETSDFAGFTIIKTFRCIINMQSNVRRLYICFYCLGIHIFVFHLSATKPNL